ncbi:MAG: UDP-2,4-diacetamido-2,4,6-trideoxy-beta-L-altropyranose hydrolase [Steroidobacter sp.]
MSEPAVIAFRVDGGRSIGSGHISRCLNLAAELRRRGAHVEFICRDMPGSLTSLIGANGFRSWSLPVVTDQGAGEPWLQVPETLDAEQSRAVLEQIRPTWLIVDHYGLGAEWHRLQRGVVGSILVIDDLCNRSLDCDVLLHTGYPVEAMFDRYAALAPEHCRRLVGPRYALIGAEYATLRRAMNVSRRDPRRILVFFGGTDATDETSKTVRVLCAKEFAHLALDVVLGPNHPAREKVKALAAGRPGAVVHEGLRSLAALVLRADLAIGAGGATTWERLCLDLPSVVVTVAANQEAATAALASDEMLIWAGRAPDVSAHDLAQAITLALNRSWELRPIVDGYGNRRAAASMLRPSTDTLRLERATLADAGLLLDWRNDPLARAMSLDRSPVSWHDHKRWLAHQLADDRVHLFIGTADEVPIGQVRLDLRGEAGVVSYSVDAALRGAGFGEALLRAAVCSCVDPPHGGFVANVRAENAASRKIFQRLGWSEVQNDVSFSYQLDRAQALDLKRRGRMC